MLIEKSTQLLVLAANQPGTLANICGTLADAKINILGVSVVDHTDHSLIRFVVEDATRASHLLGESGLTVMEDSVLRIGMAGGPGQLETVCEIVSAEGLNIQYAYASEAKDGAAVLILKTSSDDTALQALRKRFGA